MPKPSSELIEHIYRMAGVHADDTSTDAELIERYAEQRDERAFSSLMGRHGIMVWRICHRILNNTQDAEEAYQATFLTLASHAHKLDMKRPLVGWLHQVAHRTSLALRRKIRSNEKLQKTAHALSKAKLCPEARPPETYESLHGEIAKLPEPLRVAVVLHYLEGKTPAQLANVLGIKESSVRSRLTRGRATLEKKLNEHGLVIPAGALSSLLEESACSAAMPPGLVSKTVMAATALRTGKLTGGLAKLAQEVLKHTPAARPWWKTGWMISVLCVGGVTVGVGGIAWKKAFFGVGADAPPIAQIQEKETKRVDETPKLRRADMYGDPLPSGALARMGTLRLRNTRNGEGAFLGDGSTIVIADKEKLVFWEATTGREIRRLSAKLEGSGLGAWTIDSTRKTMAVHRTIERDLGQGRTSVQVIQMWTLDRAAPKKIWESIVSFQGGVLQLAPDGRTLSVAVEKDATSRILLVYDVATGDIRRKIEDFDPKIWPMQFSLDGKTLMTSKGLWDTNTWQMRKLVLRAPDKEGTLRDITNGVQSKTLSPDGKLLAGVAQLPDGRNPEEDSLSVWNTTTGDQVFRLCGVNRHGSSLLAFRPDGRTLIQADAHGRFHYWNVATGEPSAPSKSAEPTCDRGFTFNGSERTCFSPDRRLFMSTSGPVIGIWNVETGRLAAPGPIKNGMHWAVDDLALSPDGRCLATRGGGGSPQLWEAETGRAGRRLERYGQSFWRSPLDYSSDGSLVAWAWPTGAGERELKRVDRFIRWDVNTGKPSPERSGQPQAGDLRAVSENGQRLLWTSKGRVALIDRSTNKEVQHFPVPKSWDGLFVALSADGETVLVSALEQDRFEKYKVYSVRTGRAILTLDGGRDGISLISTNGQLNTLALSPDGRWLTTYDRHERNIQKPGVRLWELATGREVAKIEASQDRDIRCLLWSPNGRMLAAGDQDGAVWLWDMIAFEEIGSFKGHQAEVTSLAFSSDHSRLASGSADTTALVWNLEPFAHRAIKMRRPATASELWNALGETMEIRIALQAMDELSRRPDVALPLLRQRLRRPQQSDPKRIATLLGQLDDTRFKVRRRALEQLAEMDERIAPALHAALKRQPSNEKRRQIEEVLHKVADPVGSGTLTAKGLQFYRGVVVLEWIGSPEATGVLEELANAEESVQKTEARSALQRLKHRRPAQVLR